MGLMGISNECGREEWLQGGTVEEKKGMKFGRDLLTAGDWMQLTDGKNATQGLGVQMQSVFSLSLAPAIDANTVPSGLRLCFVMFTPSKRE